MITALDVGVVWTPCQTTSPDDWFPEQGDTATSKAARQLCLDQCPRSAFDKCLQFALHHAVDGIWAGTSRKQRERMRRTHGINLREEAS